MKTRYIQPWSWWWLLHEWYRCWLLVHVHGDWDWYDCCLDVVVGHLSVVVLVGDVVVVVSVVAVLVVVSLALVVVSMVVLAIHFQISNY